MEEKELTYKDAMAELEKIVATLESDNCDIDLLAEMTARATTLLKFCKESLFKTDREVERCLEELKAIAN